MKVLSINQFAKICRTTPRTIRFYEEKGLFMPAKIDVWTKYRYYTEDQAKDFLRIKLLQSFHIPLKKIKEKKKEKKLEGFLNDQIKLLEQDIEEKKKEILFLTSMQYTLFTGENFFDKLHRETFGSYRLFGKIFEKADYDRVGEYISEVFKMANLLGITYKKEYMVFYHNSEYQPKNTIIEVAVICDDVQKIKIPDEYFLKNFPKTMCLVYDYHGPYDYFILLYQKLFALLKEKKILVKNFVFDYYINSSSSTTSPYDIYTKLCFPIR